VPHLAGAVEMAAGGAGAGTLTRTWPLLAQESPSCCRPPQRTLGPFFALRDIVNVEFAAIACIEPAIALAER
jgi:hypothetical protein